ncbi:MAG: LytR/AlgR family response regulator transcription factor [Alloprevotella sp.]
MIKVLAIDDEPLALQQLAGYVQRVPYFTLCGVCQSAVEAKEFLAGNSVDVIFLDINMPDLNGIDFVRSLLSPPLIVFTTAYSEFAVEGFKVDAVDYLLKPFGMDEFMHAARKVKRLVEVSKKEDGEWTEEVSHVIPSLPAAKQSEPSEDIIYLKTDYKVIRLHISDICYVESMGSYLRFHLLQKQKPIMALLTMKKIEDRLPSSDFMRIHRSYIINLKAIREINRNRVTLDTDDVLPVGDMYRDKFSEYIDTKYLGR